jgi:hypothetical protein
MVLAISSNERRCCASFALGSVVTSPHQVGDTTAACGFAATTRRRHYSPPPLLATATTDSGAITESAAHTASDAIGSWVRVSSRGLPKRVCLRIPSLRSGQAPQLEPRSEGQAEGEDPRHTSDWQRSRPSRGGFR